jgi:hypothetical protein
VGKFQTSSASQQPSRILRHPFHRVYGTYDFCLIPHHPLYHHPTVHADTVIASRLATSDHVLLNQPPSNHHHLHFNHIPILTYIEGVRASCVCLHGRNYIISLVRHRKCLIDKSASFTHRDCADRLHHEGS